MTEQMTTTLYCMSTLMIVSCNACVELFLEQCWTVASAHMTGFTFSGAGLGLVALHILQPLKQCQVVCPDCIRLRLCRLRSALRLHVHNYTCGTQFVVVLRACMSIELVISPYS